VRLIAFFVVICWSALPLPVMAAAKDRHVVVICVDGLPAYLFHDASAPLTTIRDLAAKGVVAEGMIVSNPSVTWPNHTSMVTGVRPEKHGVLFNGVLERTGPGLPVKLDGRKDKTELVHVTTLFDVMHEQGLTTAAVNWPCTRHCKSIADDFPDVPDTFLHSTPRFVDAMKRAGIVSDDSIKNFGKLSPAARDRIWTRAVCQVIQERKPNLVLFHLLNVDSTHHKYSPKSPAGYTAVAYADACVRDVVDAIAAAGIRDQTTIFVVSDHGFMSISKTLQPNVVLREAGLLTVSGDQISTARVQSYPEGGTAMVYLTVPGQRDADRTRTIELFKDREGIADVITPDRFAKFGLPQPDVYPAMADLILVAKDGYGFNAVATGDDFVVTNEPALGAHGFLSTNPSMNATLVVSGKNVRQGGTLGIVENIDLAPTIASMLEVSLPDTDGKSLVDSIK